LQLGFKFGRSTPDTFFKNLQLQPLQEASVELINEESCFKMPQTTSCAAKAPEASGESQPQAEKKPACKACCACPETKRARDDCIVQYGEENCKQLIEKHRECMRQMGFNI